MNSQRNLCLDSFFVLKFILRQHINKLLENVLPANYFHLTKVKKLENIVFIGRMEENENFEENPVIENGALKTIIDASTMHKTLVFEVCFSVIILYLN